MSVTAGLLSSRSRELPRRPRPLDVLRLLDLLDLADLVDFLVSMEESESCAA